MPRPWLMFLISYGCYGVVQIYPGLNLHSEHGQWFFNPFAWQLLMNVGALLGQAARREQAFNSRPNVIQIAAHSAAGRVVASLAVAVLLIGLLFQKGEWLFGAQAMKPLFTAIGFAQWQHEWLDKSSLGPLRILHFAAWAYLLYRLVPLRSAGWTRWWLAPFRACGRHSLEVYAIGVLLTHSLRLLPSGLSSTTLYASLLVLVVVLVQFAVAAVLDIRVFQAASKR